MSIQYDLYDTPDIQQTGDAQPLHPRVVFKGTVDQEEFLDLSLIHISEPTRH